MAFSLHTKLYGGCALKEDAFQLVAMEHLDDAVVFVQLLDTEEILNGNFNSAVLDYATVSSVYSYNNPLKNRSMVRLDDDTAILSNHNGTTLNLYSIKINPASSSISATFATSITVYPNSCYLEKYSDTAILCAFWRKEPPHKLQVAEITIDDVGDFSNILIVDVLYTGVSTSDFYFSISKNSTNEFVMAWENYKMGAIYVNGYYALSGVSTTSNWTNIAEGNIENFDEDNWMMSWVNTIDDNPRVVLINPSTASQKFLGLEVSATYADMAISNNLAFIAPHMYKTDGYGFWEIGISRSSTAATVTTGATGQDLGGGTYTYRYTFYNSLFGIESGASPESDEVTFLPNSGAIVEYIIPEDPQIDQVRIYRRRTDILETYHFLVDTVTIDKSATTSTYGDIKKDTEVSYVIFAPLYKDAPPDARYLEYHRNRMWYVTDDLTLYWSEVNVPDQVDIDSYLVIGSHGDGKIVGVISLLNSLIVLKTKSIYGVYGDSISNFQAFAIIPDIGCVGHMAFAKIEKYLFFAGQRGIYVFDGAKEEKISEPIDTFWKNINQDRLPYMSMVDDKNRNILYISVSNTSNTMNDTLISYNYREGGWTVREATYGPMERVVDPNGPRIYAGDYEGNLDYMLTTPANVDWELRWPEIIGGDLGRERWFSSISAVVNATTGTVELGYRIDEGATNYTYSRDTNTPMFSIPVRQSGYTVSPVMKGIQSTNEFELLALQIEYQEIK